ncbi:MAG: glycoside hydrolase family 1 protein [Lactovum sp.]
MKKNKFLWGGSTSAFQFEGGANQGNKGKSIYDIREEKTGTSYSIASDFYGHYKEDIKLMAEMGFNSFRMSIAWTRIFPNAIEESPNMEGIQFYLEVFKELKKYEIEPVVTLFHWDMPQYLVEEYNGFLSRETIDLFKKYCKTCFKYFGEYVSYWLTLNENNLSLLLPSMFLKESISSENKDFEQVRWDCYYHSILCHFEAVKLCHEMLPEVKIGSMLASAMSYPLTPKPVDILASQKHNYETMWKDLDILTTGSIAKHLIKELEDKGVKVNLTDNDRLLMENPKSKIDFISFSYYYSLCMQDNENKEVKEAETMQMLYQGYYNPYLKRTDFGWQIDPLGLRIFMNELYHRYKLPMMIVENGCGVENEILTSSHEVHDSYRIDYLRLHIQELMKSCEEGIEILGYLPWGCIDLYSASGNKNKRYGFVYVDFDQGLERYKKDSFYWYKKVITSDGKELG